MESDTARRDWTYETLVAEGLEPERYEIADGELVEVPGVSRAGGRVANRLGSFLEEYLQAEGWPGEVHQQGRYLLREEPRRERRPDISYFERTKFPDAEAWPIPGAPDLAVEILSPNDSSAELVRKLNREYFPAGTREAWLVDPVLQTITRLRPGEAPRSCDRGDVLETPSSRGGDSSWRSSSGSSTSSWRR